MKNKNFFITLIIISVILIIYLIYNNNNNIQETFIVPRNIVVSNLIGGLANRIYMILAGLSFAERLNMDYYFLESEIDGDPHSDKNTMINELKILFPAIKFLDKSTDTSLWKRINENDNINLINNSDNNIILSGFFQNEEKYFNNYKVKFVEPINNIFKKIDTSNLFFIHFRFGDYIGTGFELNLIDYYKYCIKKIKNIRKNPLFFIITNDINITKNYIQTNNLLNQNEYIMDLGKNRLDTLYYISDCKGGICSNSSFSRIGAYFIEDRNADLIFYPIKKDNNIHINWLTTVIID